MAQRVNSKKKKLVEAYIQRGYCDGDIAKMCNMDYLYVRNRRRCMKLPPGKINICATIGRMAKEGVPDADIAHELGIGISGVKSARTKMGIMEAEKARQIEMIRQGVEEGLFNREIAERCGLAPSTIPLWKQKYLGIEPEHKCKQKPIPFTISKDEEGFMYLFYENMCMAQCRAFRADVQYGAYKTIEDALRHARSPIMEFWSMGNTDALERMVRENYGKPMSRMHT